MTDLNKDKSVEDNLKNLLVELKSLEFELKQDGYIPTVALAIKTVQDRIDELDPKKGHDPRDEDDSWEQEEEMPDLNTEDYD